MNRVTEEPRFKDPEGRRCREGRTAPVRTPLRLQLALWIAAREDPLFYQGEPATELLAPQSAVRQELERFVELGMLRQERHPGSRRLYCSRNDSPLWAVVEASRSAIEGVVAQQGPPESI